MVISPKQFMTRSLREHGWGITVANVLAACIDAVNPAAAIRTYVKRDAEDILVGNEVYHLNDYENTYVVGAGKAGAPMSIALSEILGEKLTKGIVIIKDGFTGEAKSRLSPHISLVEASHPIPDKRGVEATKNIIHLLRSAGKKDLIFCLISGGGSALLTAPAAGIELEDIQELIQILLTTGANINEINSLRKHLDAVKGGQLLKIASPARVISLILSDVIGNHLDVIASGPTVPDQSTFKDASSVLEKYKIINRVPERIRAYINRGLEGKVSETPKPRDHIFDFNQIIIIGSNKTAAQSAVQKAVSEGINSLILTTYMQGEARYTGDFIASIAQQLRSEHPPVKLPACMVFGGETTVEIRGEGKGGRNQELALGAVTNVSGLSNTALVALATDGEDGPTDAAGAVVTGETLNRANNLQMNPRDYLIRNDSYSFFSDLDDLLKPGPTYTNVNDLVFVFSF